jgi:foldase protein PrsA
VRRAAPLLLVALILGACSTFGEPAAAVVDGVEISNDTVEHDIEAVLTNQDYQDQIESQFGEIAGDGTFNSAFAAQVLSLRIYVELLDQRLEDEGIEISDADRDEIREGLRQQLVGQDGTMIFDEFPEAYQEWLVHQQAVVAAVENKVREELGTDPEAYYENDPDAFAEICVSHILVGVQGGRSPEEAEAQATELRQQITDDEATFEDLATNQSDDTFAAQSGGELGCGTRLSLQFDDTFEAAAFDLEEGELSEPVLTQFGAHLIQVTDRTIPDFEDVGDDAFSILQDAITTEVRAYIVDAVCGSDVDVSSRYGSWAIDACREIVPSLPSVEPPEGPVEPVEPGAEIQL